MYQETARARGIVWDQRGGEAEAAGTLQYRRPREAMLTGKPSMRDRALSAIACSTSNGGGVYAVFERRMIVVSERAQ
jgi:hypothetical protein